MSPGARGDRAGTRDRRAAVRLRNARPRRVLVRATFACGDEPPQTLETSGSAVCCGCAGDLARVHRAYSSSQTMSPTETPDKGRGSILGGLIAPLRLPERTLVALDAVVEAVGNLGPMRSELTRVREQTAPLEELIPTLKRLLAQTRPLSEMIPTLERLVDQTRPLGDLIPTLERLLEQTRPLCEMIPALERLIDQTRPLGETVPAIERLEERLGTRLDSVREVVSALEAEDSHLNATVGALAGEVAAMHGTLAGLQDDIQKITDRLPDPSRGPLEKARDALTGAPAQERE